MKISRYFGALILTACLSAARGSDDPMTGPGSLNPYRLALEEIVQASPGQIVQPLPGQEAQSLPGETVPLLPGQLVPPLPGQVVQSLPGQLVQSLPGQLVRSLPGQMVRSLPTQMTPALPGQVVRTLAPIAPQPLPSPTLSSSFNPLAPIIHPSRKQ